MNPVEVMYGMGGALDNSIASTIPTTLTNSETDLYIVTENAYVKQSQFTIYLEVASGQTATFYYYGSPDSGTTWYPICLYNTTTGELTQRPAVLDSGSYTANSKYYGIDNIAAGAYTKFKVTGKSATGTPAYTVIVTGRNN